jgi:hypothetical protein
MSNGSELHTSARDEKPPRNWLLLASFGFFGAIAAAMGPALNGVALNPLIGLPLLPTGGLFFYLWWKQRGGKGRTGILIGIGVGLLIFLLALVLSGFLRAAE